MNHTLKPFYTCRPRSCFSIDFFTSLWEYRNLLWIFTKRDLTLRYRYTMLGGLWSIIQPLSMMLVFSFVFSHIFRVQTASIPYPLFSYTGLIIWQSISRMINQGGTSLSDYGPMLSKVYFPKALIPLSIIMGACVDFLISFSILLGMIIFYGVSFSFNIVYLPFILMGILTLSMGLTLWISSLDVQFRDVRAALPFLLQIWMFTTPIMYPINIIPEQFQFFYNLNPLVTLLELFRWTLIGSSIPDLKYLIICSFSLLTIFFSGLLFFNKIEKSVVDRV